ncbi:MAG: hypothetical protein ACFFBP_00395 [Promethearchaeota archaeon]
MEELKSFIKQITKNARKLRGKHSPLSEIVDDKPKILKIEKIYNIKEENNIFLFIVKHHSKIPKKRYFLTISMVSQSSDFLANLAKKYFKNDENIKLVQYCTFPETSRINLLVLKELKTPRDYESSLKYLIDSRKNYRKELMKIIDQL